MELKGIVMVEARGNIGDMWGRECVSLLMTGGKGKTNYGLD